MKVVEIDIERLEPAHYNPRYMTLKQKQELRESLVSFGLVRAIIASKRKREDGKFLIIGGHQTTKIWKELGNKTISCILLDLTEEQEKELNVRLNKSGGEFDLEKLKEYFEPKELMSWGFEHYEVGQEEYFIEEERYEVRREEKIEVKLKDEQEEGEKREESGEQDGGKAEQHTNQTPPKEQQGKEFKSVVHCREGGFNKITVGKLRELLDGLDDDTEVIMEVRGEGAAVGAVLYDCVFVENFEPRDNTHLREGGVEDYKEEHNGMRKVLVISDDFV